MIIEKRVATKTIATLNDLLWMLKGHSCYPEYSKAVRLANKAIRECVRPGVLILDEGPITKPDILGYALEKGDV